MEKAKMMLDSVLHEKNKIDRSVLIKYYINEYRTTNPIFLFQFFKLVFKHIYENQDKEMLELLIDNFYDEVCMYGHLSTPEFNNLLQYFISSSQVSYIIKLCQFTSEIGDQKTLILLKKFLQTLKTSKYIGSKEIFTIKKSIYDLETKIKKEKESVKINIIDQGIFVKWKKFEVIE